MASPRKFFLPVDTNSSQTICRPRCHFCDYFTLCSLKVDRGVELFDPDGRGNLLVLHRQYRLHYLRHGTSSFAMTQVGLDLKLCQLTEKRIE